MAVRLFFPEPSDGSGSGSAIEAFSSDFLAAHLIAITLFVIFDGWRKCS
ncbi:hypothetical protein Hanom_Chr07g00663721 [Helianthus anomalus]